MPAESSRSEPPTSNGRGPAPGRSRSRRAAVRRSGAMAAPAASTEHFGRADRGDLVARGEAPRTDAGLLARWMHALRRWRAARRIRSLSRIERVLFVCHGNVCRSPYAAAAFRSLLDADELRHVDIRSAGFVGQARRSPRLAVGAAAVRGVGLAGHASSLIDARMVREADLVVVMEPGQRRAVWSRFLKSEVVVLSDLDPESPDERGIPDPMWRSAETFQAVYGQIDRCVGRLAALVSGGARKQGRVS
jgi:protein-tyrosine-phosphatase